MSAAMISARKSRPPSAILKNRIVLRSLLSSAAAVSALNGVPYYRQHNSIRFPDEIIGIKPNHALATRPTSSLRNSPTNEAAASTSSPLSTSDIHHMKLAAQLARIGSGNTFPNPAVGCVLVRHHDASSSSLDAIIGSGFHPKAGMPHAEVFALWEACGHIPDGVDAARSVMGQTPSPLSDRVLHLLQTYKGENGASDLFRGALSHANVTAYVTLEPCCHVGRTPPCAASLVAAGVNRAVVGFRDPNPRVDGGGIDVLKRAGIEVRVLRSESVGDEEKAAALECARLVECFVKRITASPNGFSSGIYDSMTGKKRMMLRAIALRQKTAGNMPSVEWLPDKSVSTEDNHKDNVDFLHQIHIDSRFLEAVDQSLWNHELVLLRLNNIVNKKKGAKILGERVAEILSAHVAQVLGHTALLYRPAEPPVLDLDELVGKESTV